MSLVIIDYGAGNLRSVQKGFQVVGSEARITRDKAAIRAAKGIVLPGVGSFDAAIKELRNYGLEVAIEEAIVLGKPFLGICLGMQHLFASSEEGREKGLGLIGGRVKKFDFSGTAWQEQSVPHMGWNRLLFKKEVPIFKGLKSGAMVYFAHSYYVEPAENSVIAATTDYGVEFVSAVCRENIFGIQFHPEKSGEQGLQILKNFAALVHRSELVEG